MFSGNVSPVLIPKGRQPRRNRERRERRRVVLEGFPVAPREFSLEEVRAYFSGDKITCLLCGRSLRRLSARHLHDIHGINEDEYRVMYGLPWRRGLTSDLSHRAYSASALRRIEDGTLNVDMASIRPLIRGAKHRKRMKFRDEIVNFQPGGQPRVPRESVARLIEIVRGGVTPKDAFSMSEMPSQAWFYTNASDEEKRELRHVIFSQSFPFQAKAQFGMSPAFTAIVMAARVDGKSDHAIAAETGVSSMTVNRHRKKHGIK